MCKIPGDEDVDQQMQVTLIKDNEWSEIDGEPCRVINFVPLATVKNGKVVALNKTTPYASVTIECKKLRGKITGFICHKMDFMHLWLAFKERGITQDEEVLIFWSKKNYRNIVYKIFSAFMPRLWVMVCPKGAFELKVDPGYRPELTGEARFSATRPIVDWKPRVMK